MPDQLDVAYYGTIVSVQAVDMAAVHWPIPGGRMTVTRPDNTPRCSAGIRRWHMALFNNEFANGRWLMAATSSTTVVPDHGPDTTTRIRHNWRWPARHGPAHVPLMADNLLQ